MEISKGQDVYRIRFDDHRERAGGDVRHGYGNRKIILVHGGEGVSNLKQKIINSGQYDHLPDGDEPDKSEIVIQKVEKVNIPVIVDPDHKEHIIS